MRSRKWVLVAGGAVLLLASCAHDGGALTSAAEGPVPVSTVARRSTTGVDSASTDPVAPSAADTTSPGVVSTAVGTTAEAPAATTTTLAPDPPPPNESFAGLTFGVDLVADVELPTAVAWRAGDPAMYVSTQDGLVRRVDGDAVDVVLDLSSETVEAEPGSERGLLGLAFDPRDGRMFVDYTDLDQNTHVASFDVVDGLADPASRREVLFIEQPGLGHKGGRLVFDAVGNLLIGSGDGGGSNGRDAQDTTKLLGVLIRVAPKLDGDGYDIPPDNPFVDGVDDRPEVYARGFRNPWTFSLDDDTGDIWIGDVGNEEFEEIDVVPGGTSGQNFGWYWFEGSNQRRSDFPDGLTPPVYDYPRSEGVAVMAGHVYRGSQIPALRGAFLFSDLTGPVWAIGANGVTRLDAERVNTMVGWAEDPDGELYLLGLDDGVFHLVQR
jgi:glucose/arabinose dehydrogenase